MYLPMLAQLNVPMVLVNDQYPDEFVHSVMIDERGQCSRAATEHSDRIGPPKRIAYTWATAKQAIRQTRRGSAGIQTGAGQCGN